MNILYLSSSSDFHIDLWTQYFTKNNNVFLFSDREDYLDNMPYKGVKIIYSRGILGWFLNSFGISSHKLFQLNKIISTKSFAKKIDKIIKENNIDIVHAHNLYFGYLAAHLKSNIPTIFTPMGSDIILHAQNNILYKYMAKKAFSKIKIVTGDSKLIQSQGYKVGASRKNNYIIQNGVDTNIFYPREVNVREKYNILSNQILIFSPRAITPNYNIDIIIESLAKIKNKGFDIKCMFSFAFGGEYYNSLKEEVRELELENQVVWLGRLTYDQMSEIYNAADIVLSIPTSDSSPKSVYEAMFCKKPVIVSDIDWTHEVLKSSDVIRVKCRDSDETSTAVINLINNKSLRNKLSNNAYQTALENFSYEKNMQTMEKIMEDACFEFSIQNTKVNK